MKKDGIAADHPLRSARWIWPDSYMYLHNHFAQFRRDFELADVPEKAPFFITADKSYRLYVNSVPVCRGPARGYQSHWPYDEVDLTPFLRRGHNWISIEAYNPGTGTFQYVHQSQAALICAGSWGGVDLKTGDKNWIYRRSPGHNRDTARYSLQMDYQEDLDLSVDDRAWIHSPEAPSGWDPKYAPKAQLWTNIPFGRPPMNTVEPRGIPMLREDIVLPERVTSHAAGCSGKDYRRRSNIAWGWSAEGRNVTNWDEHAAVNWSRAGDWLELVIEPTGEGNFRAVTLDFGKMLVGVVSFTLEGAAGGEILDFQHYQTLRSGVPAFLEDGDACSVAHANRVRLRAGANSHEFYHPLGFRNISVIGRDLTRSLTIRIRARTAVYPFTMKGKFNSSDEVLNRIHDACRATQQICALDAYVDTPWREQAQWWGDARVQARNTFYLDGDPRLLARGIRQIGEQRTAEGLTYGHAPTIAYSCILPDFALTWILTIHDYWWQTGDLKLFREQWPGIRQVLTYFRTELARGKLGLLKNDWRFWLFEDWSDLYKGKVPTFLNLWYIYTIRRLAVMLDAAGREKDSAKLRAEADLLSELAVKYLFDGETGLFTGGLDTADKPVMKFSVHDQVLALMLDIVPASSQSMMKKMILPFLRGDGLSAAKPSAFWCTYLFDEAFKRGAGNDVVGFIRKRWSPMLDTGTVWETFEWSEQKDWSCSHAWSAHPSYHLVNILAGLNQTGCAWREVRFSPVFADGVAHASSTVPSPRGMIDVQWRHDGREYEAEIRIPKGVRAEVVLPAGREFVEGAGLFKFKGAYTK